MSNDFLRFFLKHRLRRCLSTAIPSPPRAFRFHLGASFIGKPEDSSNQLTEEQKLSFSIDNPITTWKDHMLKREKSVKSVSAGDDFYFIQEGVSFGVADGVGAWITSGVDPSLFSQALCYHAHRYSKNAWAGEPESLTGEPSDEPTEGWELTPQECIELSHGGVLRERTVKAGSSTICVISLNARTGLLRAANLGDSGFSLIRSFNIAYSQSPQTHFFNCPYQLTKLPSSLRGYSGLYVDSPKDAETYSSQLRGGDIIIAYTDGFSDNVHPSEIRQITSLAMRQGSSEDRSAQDLADRLVEYARVCMFKKDKVSPFQVNAEREGISFRGGKIDEYVFAPQFTYLITNRLRSA
ncbi:hypothetical protein Clacol_006687 [Clathrus columnatus]|uniref:Protein phosphatase n=1 Tax=Clathrus columnatus TaxID=1419009 RepID=A0AAV5AKI1_9AGAM|nr:hypothetical protein Clacol_006687 [Clathrus columnatus]